MKIAYLLEHPGNGGAEVYAFNLAIEAREAGHEVCFVLGDATGALVERVREDNFDLLILPMRSSFNPVAVISSVVKLRKFISDFKPDIVHTQMLREQSLVIGAKILGAKTKLVRTFHRLDQFDWKMRPIMWIYRKYTDGYIAISEYVKEYLAENRIINNVFVIHNGTPEIVVRKKAKGLGFIGRIAPEKGLKRFVMANPKLLTDTQLAIGGDGPDVDSLTEFVKQKKLNVRLYGRVYDRNEFFENFNVLILPSLSEALPLVVLEAFSTGTPVVAFDIPSLRMLINGKNGILVKPGDYRKLAKVASDISISMDYKKYSENARETYLHGYTVSKMWFGTERLYQKLCSIK